MRDWIRTWSRYGNGAVIGMRIKRERDIWLYVRRFVYLSLLMRIEVCLYFSLSVFVYTVCPNLCPMSCLHVCISIAYVKVCIYVSPCLSTSEYAVVSAAACLCMRTMHINMSVCICIYDYMIRLRKGYIMHKIAYNNAYIFLCFGVCLVCMLSAYLLIH